MNRLSKVWLVVIVAALATVTTFVTSPKQTAIAAEGDLPLQVVFDTFTPIIPQPGGTLKLTGRVSNTSDQTVTNVSAQLRISSTRITDRAVIADIARGSLDAAAAGPDTYIINWLADDVTESLPPRQEATFALDVPFASLPLFTPGVYVIGVEAIGQLAGQDTPLQRQGLTRTFLPWFPKDVIADRASVDATRISPTNLVMMWPVADWPSRDSNGVLLGDRTPQELSPGGRLRNLVTAGSGARGAISWVIDPEVTQTAADMSTGYQVWIDGDVRPGDRSADAAAFLDELANVTTSATGERKRSTRDVSVAVLPYANIDAAAARRGGLDLDVVRATTAAPPLIESTLGRSTRTTVYWAPTGQIDQSTVDLLATTGISTIVVADTSVPPTPDLDFTPTGIARIRSTVGPIPAIVRDTGLSESLAMRSRTRNDVILARQRFLAETGVITTESPANPRTVVAAPANVLWNPPPELLASLLAATRRAPWIQSTSLNRLLEANPNEVSRSRVKYSQESRVAELSPDYVAQVRNEQRRLNALSSVIDDPTGLIDPINQALLRSLSIAWRSDPKAGEALLQNTAEIIESDINKVRVLSSGSVTFSGETGVIPVTVTNELDRTVTVGLRLSGIPPLRLDAEPVDNISIEPGRNTTIEVDARVVGTGTLPVSVQLLSPDGSEFGKPVQLELTSTAYARAATWVIGISFIAIAVFVVVGIIRRIHRGARGKTPAASGTVSS